MRGAMAADGQDRGGEAGPPPSPRGSSPSSPPRSRFRVSRGWVAFFIGLLVLNIVLSSRAMQPTSRVRVPYSPVFLQQVKAGHVAEITSKGTAVQGTFTKKLAYEDSKPTTRFRTEIPTFADENALSHVLQQKAVVVNAVPLDRGPPWWQSLLVGF